MHCINDASYLQEDSTLKRERSDKPRQNIAQIFLSSYLTTPQVAAVLFFCVKAVQNISVKEKCWCITMDRFKLYECGRDY